MMAHWEATKAARVLSLAMLQNPIHVAVYQGSGEDVREEIELGFDRLLHEKPGIVFLSKSEGKIVGVMRMKSCCGPEGAEKKPGPKAPKNTSDRISHWHGIWAANDPGDSHWHLGPIGVLPSFRGSGIGSTLMDRFCREVDACRAAAYLETDLAANVRFYEKFGFNTVEEADILGVKNYFMWRPAQQIS